MANQLVSLVIIFWLLLSSRSSATRVLRDDDHSKIKAQGSSPKPDSQWNGHSSHSGNLQPSPPTSATNAGRAVRPNALVYCRANPNESCSSRGGRMYNSYERASP
ncbi:ABC transporter domain-containing protein [Psidium guajava]|nr:ABC transporter domain-containing protein [Psidium guajava]